MAEGNVVAAPRTRPSWASRFFGRYIIKNRFQFKFTFIVFGFLASAVLVIWLQGNWVIQRMINTGIVSGEQAVAHLNMLNQNILYTSILALAMTFGLTLFFSHFIAGPLYRFERVFDRLKEGDLSGIVRLRKYDELKDTAESLNQALASLRLKIRKDRETISVSMDKIKKFSEKLRQAGKIQEATELDQLVFDLQNSSPQIKI